MKSAAIKKLYARSCCYKSDFYLLLLMLPFRYKTSATIVIFLAFQHVKVQEMLHLSFQAQLVRRLKRVEAGHDGVFLDNA